ncbi:TlpA disulfide reductase family protein [Mucilaginibacter sp.]|uniref:TlpA family protein disulfide reductase n=1 Tax=Mucilaginibacter sp. TaxID=1882438 RepID=UPI002845ABEF|nr:TlpA disulfide reductase family protein [Mucilaginibacter sp.]MDR3694113.1 TlpA disulfide reductase family protein [Mucilaginibacter sp.]
MNKLSLISLALLIFSCNTNPKTKKRLNVDAKKDSLIVVINQTGNKNYQFRYFGYFGNSERPGFPNNDTLKIKSVEPIVAYETSRPDFSDLTYFTLAPRDTVYIDSVGYPAAKNASLNEKLQFMRSLQFNAGSVNYSIKMDYATALKSIEDSYMNKRHIVDSYTNKVEKGTLLQAKRLINFDHLASLLTLQKQFNTPNDSILNVLKTADSTSWNYLPFRDVMVRYKAYISTCHHINQADQYIQYIRKNLPSAIQDYAVFSFLKDYQPDSKSKLDTLNNLTSMFAKTAISKALANYLSINLKKYQQGLDAQNIKAVELISQETGNTTSLNAIIKRHKNKIIYLDFWASWCAPCIAEMPSSYNLSNKLKKTNPDIVFLYLSKDEDMAAWKNKALAVQLQSNNSFLVLKNNAFVEFSNKYNINTIPHYLIIGKDGRVINPDAPRPDDSRLELILSRLAK